MHFSKENPFEIDFNQLSALSKDDNIQLQESAFKYLFDLKRASSILADAKAISAIKLIFKNLATPFVSSSAQLCFKYKFVKILVRIIKELNDELGVRYNHASNSSSLMVMISDISKAFSSVSFKFCLEFHTENGLSALFEILNNKTLVKNYQEKSKSPADFDFMVINDIMRSTLCTLLNLSKAFDIHKQQWKNCNALKSLNEYLAKVQDISDNKMRIFMTICNVCEESDHKSIDTGLLQEVIPQISKLVGFCSKLLETKVPFKMVLIQTDDDRSEREVSCVNSKLNIEWNLVELLNSLDHMCMISSSIKKDIYYSNNMDHHLRVIVYYGQNIEREFALKLLWHLCFDDEVAENVIKDVVFYNYIKNLIGKDDLDPSLTRVSTDLTWHLLEKFKDRPNILESLSEKAERSLSKQAEILNDKHIMISYNSESRELCLRIKAELEKLNFKVWIDVENISGSSLEAMANAIENSLCVLMCMTNKYNKSLNCKAEAEYAFQCSKPIIHLLMEKNFKPHGWLGIILGSKPYISFNDFPFEVCLKLIKIELNKILDIDDENEETFESYQNYLSFQKTSRMNNRKKWPSKKQNPNAKNSKKKNAFNEFAWEEVDVDKWFREKRISQNVAKCLRPCDGRLLFELYNVNEEAPDFFYENMLLNSEYEISFKDYVLFVDELKKLFD